MFRYLFVLYHKLLFGIILPQTSNPNQFIITTSFCSLSCVDSLYKFVFIFCVKIIFPLILFLCKHTLCYWFIEYTTVYVSAYWFFFVIPITFYFANIFMLLFYVLLSYTYSSFRRYTKRYILNVHLLLSQFLVWFSTKVTNWEDWHRIIFVFQILWLFP